MLWAWPPAISLLMHLPTSNKYLDFFLVLFGVNQLFAGKLYFAIAALAGQSSNQHSSLLFSGYVILSSIAFFALFSYLICAYSSCRSRYLLVPIFFAFLYFVSLLVFEATSFSWNQFLVYISYAPSSFCVGLVFAKRKLPYLSFAIQLLCLLAAISTISVFNELVSSSIISLMTFYGGGNYQSYSHFASTCFLLSISKLLSSSFVRNPISCLLSLLQAITLLVGIVLSAGRSGFYLIILGTLLLLAKIRIHSRKSFFGLLLLLLIATLLLLPLLISSNDSFNDSFYYLRFGQSIDRILSVFLYGLSDTDSISGRDSFYSMALDLFSKRPLIGYGGPVGLSAVKDIFYSHNIVLDIILHGGILGLFLFLPLLLYVSSRLLSLSLDTSANQLAFVSLAYCAVILNFSGSYLTETLFWFAFGYGLSTPRRHRLWGIVQSQIAAPTATTCICSKK